MADPRTPDAVDTVGAAAPMETLLADAGSGALRRWLPGMAGVKLAAALARDPAPLARTLGGTAAELAKVAAGRSDAVPDKKDRRFADPAWTGNPLLRRVAQAYLVGGRATERIVESVPLDWRSAERMRFLTDNLVEALAPSNNPLLNPAVWKAALDTGGGSLARGAAALVRDLAAPPRIPRMVEPQDKVVGRDLGLTPGEVVLRTPVFELIRYTPQTERVSTAPLLVVPPTINKFYVVDLAPGRSLVEFLVRSGQQVFMISWRNPEREHADWGLDTYGEAVLTALDAVERMSGVDRSLLLGLCSGGIISAMVLGHLAATGEQERIAGLALCVTVLDQERAGTTGALAGHRTNRVAVARSARRGYLDGADLAEVFAWLRPRDLVWNYWVNNYLLGRAAPAFDILSWNADTTRMSAALHRDFIALAEANALVRPGAARMLGTPVDLSAVHVDAYVVAGVADHLCPWQNCYATTQLLGGKTRFVLSTSGHIAAIVNPPGNPKASFTVGEGCPPEAERWQEGAQRQAGSWWDDFAVWLAARGGPERDAPATPGGPGSAALGPAPGTYVFAR